MVNFNINFLLYGIQWELTEHFNSLNLSCDVELTLKPENGDVFTHIPASQRPSYLRFVSSTYKITITNKALHYSEIYYMFIRNGKASDNTYTRLSSIEICCLDNKSFHSFYKQHFIGDMSKNEIGLVSSLTFSTIKDMESEAVNACYTVCSAIKNYYKSRCI